MSKVPEMFGSLLFNDAMMRERLPKDTYRALRKTMQDGKSLDPTVANIVANAMKDWAIEHGATHYTHWFQPLNGITAEKHDSFISPAPDGHVIMEFSGKELIKGEPDASSFPSGGLRSTFEARGYTAWDPTSYAFIKDGTLCIPTAFCSYGGHALDKKTPLLRSMEAINRQAMRLIKLFGSSDVTNVRTTAGPEQEYFIISNEMYQRRPDLIYCGRTLFGAKPPKGQEMEDHYFGAIKPKIIEYMSDLDETLWKLGILAKTRHNETAPAQHELAPIFTTTNIACDDNQLTMEMMKRVAARHGLTCLLHEKPFEGVNGSGKHNNWSLITSTGVNMLDPGDSPRENAQFLLVLAAVIKAVDEHQDLLRISVASAGNDHRLGAHEAPPAIISMFLGDELTEILESIENDTLYDHKDQTIMKIGVHTLPRFPRDTTDRNRTSPFAFTGNKFEFRSLGSSSSIADPNIVLNTIVAESFRQFADELESSTDFMRDLNALIRRTIMHHKRIIFNGNNYSGEWVAEAERRGLLNLPSTPDALPLLETPANVELFERHRVLSADELHARTEILLDNYSKTINIEALTMVEMARRDILPAVYSYIKDLAETAVSVKQLGLDVSAQTDMISELSELAAEFARRTDVLDKAEDGLNRCSSELACAQYAHDVVVNAMEALRQTGDTLETRTAAKYWPYPSYGEMLFSVK